MTTEATQHRFDATIQGKQNRGQRVMLTLDWKLPGSRYEFTLYVDPSDAESLNIGDRQTWSIVRESLKDGKSGKYPSDFFWGWDKSGAEAPWTPEAPEPFPDNGGFHAAQEIAAEVVNEYRNPRDMEPQTEVRTPIGKTEVQISIEKGMAFNAAYTLKAATLLHDEPLWDADIQEIRVLRDKIYHGVILVPVAPLHFCYPCEQPRKQSKSGVFVHKLGEQWCSPDGMLDGAGEPITEESE